MDKKSDKKSKKGLYIGIGAGIVVAAIVAVLLIVLLPKGNEASNNGSTIAEIKGNCHVLECIEKLDVNGTLEDAEKVMGFEGELKNESTESYEWVINDAETIRIAFKAKTITAYNYDDEVLANSSVDFSGYSDLKKSVSSGITYDDFVKAVGGVEGTLIEKSSITNKYTWVAGDGKSYLNASFNINSHKCTFMSGMIY